MTEHRCHWAGSNQPRMLRTHRRDCDPSACDGCEPCPERHCRICGREHVTIETAGTDQTCADCLHEVREDYRRIITISVQLPHEAQARGAHSHAAMLAGPTADVEAWRHRQRLVVRGHGCRDITCPDHGDRPQQGPRCERGDPMRCGHSSCLALVCPNVIAWASDNRDEPHPDWVLDTWEREATAVLGFEFRWAEPRHLTTCAHDPEFPFEEMAAELRRCRGHLEDVLHDSSRPETGAPCPSCGRAKLEHVHGDTETEDAWCCPRKACGQTWTEAEYRNRVEGAYLQLADRLTASQIRETYRVPEGSTRGWATKDRVRKRGRDAQGRQLYDVADVLACRDGVVA